MKKIILSIILSLLLFSCGKIDNSSDIQSENKDCIEEIPPYSSIYEIEYKKYCNYKTIFAERAIKRPFVSNIAGMGDFDKEIGNEIVSYCEKQEKKCIDLLDNEFDKIKLYHIYRIMYGFDDEYINKTLGLDIPENFKNLYLSLGSILSGEMILTRQFDVIEIGISKNELKYLDKIFELEPTILDGISGIMLLKYAYQNIPDDEISGLFVNVMKKYTLGEHNNNGIVNTILSDLLLEYDLIDDEYLEKLKLELKPTRGDAGGEIFKKNAQILNIIKKLKKYDEEYFSELEKKYSDEIENK